MLIDFIATVFLKYTDDTPDYVKYWIFRITKVVMCLGLVGVNFILHLILVG